MGAIFSKIVIVGVGLLGGSLGLALKKRKLADVVIGVDSNSECLAEAVRLGVIDQAAADLKTAFELLDSFTNSLAESPEEKENAEKNRRKSRYTELVIVCTPVGSVANIVLETAKIAGNRRLLITDVGSTKNEIARQLEKQLPDNIRYVGSHPIAGSEKKGPKNAKADLFAGHLTVLTPTDEETVSEATILEHFWNLLGSTVVQIPPKQHDSILARTSHFPHLLASLLLQTLKIGDHIMVGPGFRSTTRLAASDPSLWADVFLSNKEAVSDAIDVMQKHLNSFRQLLHDDDHEEIVKLLTKSKKQRDALEK